MPFSLSHSLTQTHTLRFSVLQWVQLRVKWKTLSLGLDGVRTDGLHETEWHCELWAFFMFKLHYKFSSVLQSLAGVWRPLRERVWISINQSIVRAISLGIAQLAGTDMLDSVFATALDRRKNIAPMPCRYRIALWMLFKFFVRIQAGVQNVKHLFLLRKRDERVRIQHFQR